MWPADVCRRQPTGRLSMRSAAEFLAVDCGILVTPGSIYGPGGARHIRVALTATDERVAAAAARLTALNT